jgi:hypothetical protein
LYWVILLSILPLKTFGLVACGMWLASPINMPRDGLSSNIRNTPQNTNNGYLYGLSSCNSNKQGMSCLIHTSSSFLLVLVDWLVASSKCWCRPTLWTFLIITLLQSAIRRREW